MNTWMSRLVSRSYKVNSIKIGVVIKNKKPLNVFNKVLWPTFVEEMLLCKEENTVRPIIIVVFFNSAFTYNTMIKVYIQSSIQYD